MFDIYDFHGDGFIHKDDIVMILHNLKPTNTKMMGEENIVTSVKTKTSSDNLFVSPNKEMMT